jgi:hypothetical protein
MQIENINLKFCPNCGKIPKLKVEIEGNGYYPLYYRHYECRKWLGLRLCRLEHGWSEYGTKLAADYWNKDINE